MAAEPPWLYEAEDAVAGRLGLPSALRAATGGASTNAGIDSHCSTAYRTPTPVTQYHDDGSNAGRAIDDDADGGDDNSNRGIGLLIGLIHFSLSHARATEMMT